MLNIQIENLPKLRMSNSQARSQVSNILSSRHKTKTSIDSMLEKSDLVSTPNRIRKKDQLSILDEALDAKEISIRNNPNPNSSEDFNIYKEHLELLSVYIKNSNPVLAFSLNRGISGFSRSIHSLQKLIQSINSRQIPVLPEKKSLRDSQVQTCQVEPEENWKSIHKKDLKIFKHLEKKLEEMNFTKVSQKLKDLHKSLKKAVSEVPGLSKFPELGNFNVQDTINQLEKHVRNLQNEVSQELVKRKLAVLPVHVLTQTEVPIIDPEKYFILEKMLVDKEQEIFELNKKLEILKMEKKNLQEKYETSQSCLNQCEKRLYVAREKEAKFDALKEEMQREKERYEKKIISKKEKLITQKKENQGLALGIENQRQKFLKLVNEYKESVMQGKIAEKQLEELKSAWVGRFGEDFKFSDININEIAGNINSNLLQDYDDVLNKAQTAQVSNDSQRKSPGAYKSSNLTNILRSPTSLTGKSYEDYANDSKVLGQTLKSSSNSSKKSLNRLSTQAIINSANERNRKGSVDVGRNRAEGKRASLSPHKFTNSFNQRTKVPGLATEDSCDGLENCKIFEEQSSLKSTKARSNLKQSFLSRVENKLKGENQNENDIERKFSGQNSTQFTEDSSNTSFQKKLQLESEDFYESMQDNPDQLFEFLKLKSQNGEKLSNLQEKFLHLYQGSNLKTLIREDPEEYFKHTFTLLDPNDELNARILKEFPVISTITRRMQFDLFTIMLDHEKMRCQGQCKHLSKVAQLKYKYKGVPYPIRKLTVEF